jgi:hypothetical protein
MKFKRKQLYLASIVSMLLFILIGYQNCSSPGKEEIIYVNSTSTNGSTNNPGNGNDTVDVDSTIIKSWNGNDSEISHQIGKVSGSTGWEANASAQTNLYLNYGPYYSVPNTGHYKVSFYISPLSVTSINKMKTLTLDVYNLDNAKTFAVKDVWSDEFLSGSQQVFTLSFYAQAGKRLEFRSLWKSGMNLRLDKIVLRPASGGLLDDYFTGKAEMTAVGQMPNANGWNYVKDGIWYHFDRKFQDAAVTPSWCHISDAHLSIATAVSTSTNKGRTWSPYKVIISPSFSLNDDDACSVLDGTTFFNPKVNKWQIFAQCLGKDGSAWKLCLYSSRTIDGQYVREQAVKFQPKQIWNLICVDNNSNCPIGKVYDEGTPEFIQYKFGYFYFTFHGYDGQKGYRGIARTLDFASWEATGADLPGGAIFSKKDCLNWKYSPNQTGESGCIGGGAATTIKSGDYYYTLIEAPNVSLACLDGQYWPIGLIRSSNIAESSGNWEHALNNPIIKPLGNFACALQYARFIKDGDEVYLYYYRKTSLNSYEVPLYYLGKE